jgi:hypothetical protein
MSRSMPTPKARVHWLWRAVDVKARRRLYCMAAGGLAFWLPAIILYAVFQQPVSILWLNIVSVLGLAALAILDWVCGRWTIRWNWGLAGVYILGPISILMEAVFSGVAPPWKGRGQSLFFDLVVCLLPPMTLWLSALALQIFSVLAATISLPLLELLRHKYRADVRTEAEPDATI